MLYNDRGNLTVQCLCTYRDSLTRNALCICEHGSE
jgi:hypothetical protein